MQRYRQFYFTKSFVSYKYFDVTVGGLFSPEYINAPWDINKFNDLLNHVNAKWVIPIPIFMVKGLYFIGKMMNNIFLKENATKLISDNVFPSDKIRQYIDLPEIYVQNASLEISWCRNVLEHQSISGEIIMPFLTGDYEGEDLNDESDWFHVERLVKANLNLLPNIKNPPFPE